MSYQKLFLTKINMFNESIGQTDERLQRRYKVSENYNRSCYTGVSSVGLTLKKDSKSCEPSLITVWVYWLLYYIIWFLYYAVDYILLSKRTYYIRALYFYPMYILLGYYTTDVIWFIIIIKLLINRLLFNG